MTVGSTARLQFNMAKAQTNYGNQLDWLNASYLSGNKLNKYSLNTNATKTLDELLKSNSLKNKDSAYIDKFTELYKSIYGTWNGSDDSSSDTSSSQAIKTASSAAGNAAQSIKSFANGLKYNSEVDVDAYKTQAQSFVDSYNSMIDKVGNSDNNYVLQKGVLMVNTGKVYSSALNRAGITVGSDNKLTLKDDLSKVKASDIKNTFGTMGFSDKVIQKAGQINTLTGGNGLFTANAVGSSNNTSSSNTQYKDNSGTMKDLAEKVKELATSVKSYVQGLGSDEKAFSPTDFTKTAKDFVDSYNSFIDEAAQSDKTAVRVKGSTLQSAARSYKYSLQRAGINVDSNGKLSLADETKLNSLTEKDVKYSFGTSGSFLDKVTNKANEIKSLVSSASAMGYNSNKTANYAYSTGALFSVYA